MDVIRELAIESWHGQGSDEGGEQVIFDLEQGNVLVLPGLAFELSEQEQKFLSPMWSDGKAKNISLQPKKQGIVFKGAQGSPSELIQLRSLLQRYSDSAQSLVLKLLPAYRNHLEVANTSFRPFQVETRSTSYRKDDSRLHVDSFPSNPTMGTRLLRVFTNVNPAGVQRVWRVGEPFANMAERFLPKTKGMWPLQSTLMHAFKITKRPRTEYDHRMLQLHDLAKEDMSYQKNSLQQEVLFSPGTTWVVYSDQVMHAAMSGQYMFEQTFHIPSEALVYPELSPLAVLQKSLGRRLI